MYQSATSRTRLTMHDVSVSVVVPVYRSAAYIEACVRSVLNQQAPVDEIVLVDDRGGDDSIERVPAEWRATSESARGRRSS